MYMGKNQNNTQQNTQTISSNTQIIFTVKGFIAFITTLLTLFVGFYTLVIVPSLNKSEQYQEKLYKEQKEYIAGEFDEVNKSIDSNTKAIKLNTNAINSTNERFEDLYESVKEIANSGGSFGDNVINPTNTNNVNLALNETDD